MDSTLSHGRKVVPISLVPSNAQRTFLENATETYHRALWASPAAGYLESRGLSADSATRFRLGFVDAPLTGHEYLRERLAIPYLTRAGVVEIKFRKISDDDNGPKYLYGAGATAQRIFNPRALFESVSTIVVCEGELDAITMEQAGVPAVGIPGVDNWRPYFARVFAGYERVLIMGDSDDKGQGEGFASDLAQLVPNARPVMMPDKHDVNSFYIDEGPEALRKWVGIDE